MNLVQQLGVIHALISSGAEKITTAFSRCISALTMAGAPGSGPLSLLSILKRKLRSQKPSV